MTLLATIGHYCQDNKIGPRKLARAATISTQQAQRFLNGSHPTSDGTIALQSWYNLQQIQQNLNARNKS